MTVGHRGRSKALTFPRPPPAGSGRCASWAASLGLHPAAGPGLRPASRKPPVALALAAAGILAAGHRGEPLRLAAPAHAPAVREPAAGHRWQQKISGGRLAPQLRHQPGRRGDPASAGCRPGRGLRPRPPAGFASWLRWPAGSNAFSKAHPFAVPQPSWKPTTPCAYGAQGRVSFENAGPGGQTLDAPARRGFWASTAAVHGCACFLKTS